LKKELSPEYRADTRSLDKISTTPRARHSGDCAKKSSAMVDASKIVDSEKSAGEIGVLVCETAVAGV
jgi:hypothetical protein